MDRKFIVLLVVALVFVSLSEASFFSPKKKGVVDTMKDRAEDMRRSAERTKNRLQMAKKGVNLAASAKGTVDDVSDEIKDTGKRLKKEVDKTLSGEQSLADTIDGAADIVEKKGQYWSKLAANVLRSKKGDVVGTVDETADQLKKKGKQYSGQAAKTIKQQRKQWLGNSELGSGIDDLADSLQETGEEYSDAAAATMKHHAGSKKNVQRKRVEHDEDDAEEGWFSGVLSKMRGGSQSDDDEEDYEHYEDNDEYDDEEESEGWFSGITNKLRGGRRSAETDDEEDEGVMEYGRRLASEAGDKLQQKKRQYVDNENEDDEEDDASEGWFSGIAKKFHGDDDDEDLASRTQRRAPEGKKFIRDSAASIKNQRRNLIPSKNDGMFGGVSKRLGKKDLGDHIDDAVDGISRRGQKAAQYASDLAAKKKRQDRKRGGIFG